MFKEEETQYCSMCEEWAEKYDQLKARSEETIDGLLSVQYQLADNCKKYEQALQEIKNFIYIEKAKVFVDMEDFWEQILQKCEVIND